MKGFEIKFNIYANNESEVEKARMAIIEFISQNAHEGRAVSANKIAEIIPQWQSNPLIRQKIINYFS